MQVGVVAVVDVEHAAAVAVVHVRRRVVAAGVDQVASQIRRDAAFSETVCAIVSGRRGIWQEARSASSYR